ncbi:MAG: C40 family peptidase [Bacteroidia bacterium]|nr:C40 family peptidase [Bacteroidia bacterium]
MSDTLKSTRDTSKQDRLLAYAEKHLGKRYGYGKTGKGGFDCSGFVMQCFNNFGVELPHSSSAMAYLGNFVSFEHARKGDLIFFTGRSSETETVGHVGIVTEIKNNVIYFIHASVQAGVIISNTEEIYYKKRFMLIKRLPI